MNRGQGLSWTGAVVIVAIVSGIVALAYSPVIRGPSSQPASLGSSPASPSVAVVARGMIRSVLVLDGVVARERADGAPTDHLEAVAIVPPELLYRLYDLPRSISVKLDRGPGPFDCPLSSLGARGGESGDPLEAPVELRCRIPQDIRAFPGVRLKIAVVTGEVRNVLILPLTAVAGESDQGYVTLLRDGERIRREVRLGLTDGINIEIREGLSEGDRVLIPPDDPLGLLGDGS